MTSFEQHTNRPLVSPESRQALDDYCEEITDPTTDEMRLRRQELLASSALADARMFRDSDETVGESNDYIIGSIDVEQ